jgi:eukaryotic-like serine/threonine-protein kinase
VHLPELAHYRIVSPLGAGGMGEVFLATDNRLNRNVAIKLLPLATSADEEAQARMLREARLVATIDHPNVCTIYDVGSDNGRHYIAMQYVPGETLADRLSRGRMPLAEIVDVGRQITAALAEAHGRGIVHRDIKPGNIMIGTGGLVKVLDFGLAKFFANDEKAATEVMISTPGLIAGTTAYMSPEQLRAEALDGRSDLFSLGIVLYEMATGRRPFQGVTATALMSAILQDEAPPVADAETAALEPVIRKALAKPVAARFASAAAMQEALVALTERRRKTSVRREGARTVGRAAKIQSLAVLPPVASIADESLAYVEDGVHERLTARLSHIPKVKVIAHSTAVRYRGRDDLAKIAEELRVQTLVAGRLAATPESLKLHLELIDPLAADPLWQGDFKRTGREIETLVAEAADQIANAIREHSSVSNLKRRKKAHVPRTDPAAEKLYLRGRVQWNKRHPDAVRQAIASFQEAVEIDPTYANAYAGLADSYTMLGFLQAIPPAQAVPKAKAAAMRAIELDPGMVEPHATLGYVAGIFEWNWPVAERELLQAMELNPNYPWAPHWYGLLLAPRGPLEKSLRCVRQARDLDPLSPIINIGEGIPLHLHRRFEEAVRAYSQVLEVEPRFAPGHYYIGQSYEQLGKFDAALQHLEMCREISGRAPIFLGALGHCFGRAGRTADAQGILKELEERSKERYVSPFNMALVHLGLGEREAALQNLERAFEEHAAWVYHTPADARFDVLRDEPRFQSMVAKLGIKEES